MRNHCLLGFKSFSRVFSRYISRDVFNSTTRIFYSGSTVYFSSNFRIFFRNSCLDSFQNIFWDFYRILVTSWGLKFCKDFYENSSLRNFYRNSHDFYGEFSPAVLSETHVTPGIFLKIHARIISYLQNVFSVVFYAGSILEKIIDRIPWKTRGNPSWNSTKNVEGYLIFFYIISGWTEVILIIFLKRSAHKNLQITTAMKSCRNEIEILKQFLREPLDFF